MRIGPRSIASWLVGVALAAGCAPAVAPAPPRTDLYVVLPGTDGTVGAITATQGASSVVLDTAYASARVSPQGRLEPSRSSEQEVREVFGPSLGGLPPAPLKFTLNFEQGQDVLTAASEQELPRILEAIRQRPAAEVVVIGHADRIGTVQRNDVLSLQRAEKVRQELERIGIPPELIEVAGRGSREELYPSASGVGDERNRRVEITVR